MKNMKKWLSVLLTLAMLATTLCMPVFAADATSDKTVAGEYVYNFLNGDITDTPMNFYDLAVKNGWSYSSADQTVAYSGEDTYVTQIKLKAFTVGTTTYKAATQFNTFCNTCFYNATSATEYVESNSKNGFVPISGIGDGKTKYGDRGTTLGVSIREQSYVSINYGILATVTWEQDYTDATGFVDSLLTVTYQPLPGFSYTATEATLQDVATVNDYISVFAEQEFEAVCEPLMFQVGTDSDYANSSITNGMCYVFRLSDGTFVIYDGGGWGGTTYDNVHNITIANRILAVLDEYNVLDEITVSAWVLTHPHNDHMQAFGNIVTRIANSEITNVKIERIIANIPDFTEQTAYSTSFDWSNWEFDVDAKTDAATLMSYHNLFDTLATVQGTYVYKAHVGQKYFLADASIEILYTHDVHEGKIPNGAGQDSGDQGDSNDINGISIVSQVTMWKDGDTVMMTGDASYRGIDWVNAAYGKNLASTYVQAPHHGHPSCFMAHNAYDGVDHLDCERKFYDLVSADYLLWPCGKGRFRELNVEEDEEGVDNGIEYAGRTGVDVPTREYARDIGMDNTYVALCMTTMFDFFGDDGAQLAKHEVTYLLRTQKDLKEGMPVEDGNYKLIDDIIINQDIDHTGEDMIDSDEDGTEDTYVSDGVITLRLIRQSYSTLDTSNSGSNFTGTLDGQGHSIIFADGMSYSPERSNSGVLFESLSSGTIKNLGLGTETSPIIYNDKQANVGIFAGTVLAGATPVIDGVKVYATFDGTERTTTANIGGFVGKFTTADATLTVKNSTIDISFTEGATSIRNVGGLVGYLNAASNVKAIGNTISVDITTAATGASCYAGLVGKADVSGASIYAKDNTVNFTVDDTTAGKSAHYIGGVIGYSSVIFTAEGNTVNFTVSDTESGTGSHSIGGVMGYAFDCEDQVNFKDNVITVDIDDIGTTTAKRFIGGVLGTMGSANVTINGDTVNGEIASSIVAANHIGGVVGSNEGSSGVLTLTNVTNNANMTITGTTNARVGGLVGSDKYQITIDGCTNNGDISASTYAGGVLGYFNSSQKVVITNTANTGDITAESYAAGFIASVNKPNSLKEAVRIENCLNTGTITSSDNYASGFITCIFQATKSGGVTIEIDNCENRGTIESKKKAYAAGGIVGDTSSCTALTLSITNCTNSGTVKHDVANSYAGGIVGLIGDTTALNITNSLNSGTVSTTKASFVGGILGGVNADAIINIKNSVNNGLVSGLDNGGYVGGIMGLVNQCGATVNITSCVNADNDAITVKNGHTSGGILGAILATTATSASNVTIKDCYNTGAIDGRRIGGIVGCGDSSTSVENILTVDGCYNSGTITAATWAGGIIGLTCPANPWKEDSTVVVLSEVVIKNCVNNGTMVDNTNVSGRVGAFAGCGYKFMSIDNCVNYDDSLVYTSSTDETKKLPWIGSQNDAVKGVFSNMYTYNCTVPTMDFVGASMRIVETETYVSGLTFKGQVDTAMLDAYMAAVHPTNGNDIVKDIKVGMLVVPTHMLEKCNNIFTATSVAAAEAVEFTLEEVKAADGCFYTSLVGFDTDWANTEFSVITYVSFKISNDGDWLTVYGDYDPADARSIGYVANEVKGMDAYNNYSAAQQAMIDTYAGLYVENN